MPSDSKRPRGRPRLDAPRRSVTTWLPNPDYDKLATRAQQSGRSVSAVLRAVIVKSLPPTKNPG